MLHNLGFLSETYFLVPIVAITAWALSIRIFPVIIYVVQKKNLMDDPGERSSHSEKTPTLGGVGMFLAFSITLMLFGIFLEFSNADLIKLISIVATTTILLFLGIKDDLIVLAPKKKFMGQIFSAGIVILLTDIRITGFGGMLGVWEMPYWISVLFSLFVFIVIINAFNLTDGIDGLAGSLATLASLIFGVFFLVNGDLLLAVTSFTLIGAILGFLVFNFAKRDKLFMGDSGSLFLGYLLAYQGMSFIMVNHEPFAEFTLPHAPTALLAVLSYPIIDSLRVFTIRLIENRSPFSPDRNHIHHRFIARGFSHKQATAAIILSNILLVATIWFINDWNPTLQLVIGFVLGSLLYKYPFLIPERRGTTPGTPPVPARQPQGADIRPLPVPETAAERYAYAETNELQQKRTLVFSEAKRRFVVHRTRREPEKPADTNPDFRERGGKASTRDGAPITESEKRQPVPDRPEWARNPEYPRRKTE